MCVSARVRVFRQEGQCCSFIYVSMSVSEQEGLSLEIAEMLRSDLCDSSLCQPDIRQSRPHPRPLCSVIPCRSCGWKDPPELRFL